MAPLAALLSDRLRPVVMPVLGLLLVILWLGYGRVVDARAVTWDEVAEAPGQAVGRTVVISFGRVVEMGDEGFVLRDEGLDVAVRGSLPDLAVGRIVSVMGPLKADGVVELGEGRVHRLRRLKWLSGVVAMLVVGGLVIMDLGRLWRLPDA